MSGRDASSHLRGGNRHMQAPVAAVQTAQWSWILSTLWSWIWAGLAWIVEWQARGFGMVFGVDSFWGVVGGGAQDHPQDSPLRSGEHTAELQSQAKLLFRLLLGKKKRTTPEKSV